MAKKQYITYEPISGGFRVVFENGVHLGDLLVDVDGFYHFWIDSHGGAWESWVLRLICDKMDELNRPWEKEIDRYFEEHKYDHNEPGYSAETIAEDEDRFREDGSPIVPAQGHYPEDWCKGT